ncbi:MAG: undecaprenyl-diphosphate phosphatase [Thermoleophilia bacterium]|nr:undecaprenyl-diphosphate phosphatase [Thermoleophilia bacterium]
MNTLEAIVLGLVQGLTEFLPISSSGHLLIVPKALGWDEPGAAFTAVIQLGTIAAVLLYFRRDLARIFAGWWRGVRDASQRDTTEYRIFWMVALGTIPIAVFGLIFKDQIETIVRNVQLTAILLIVFGLVMEVADRCFPERDELEQLTVRSGVLIGVAQALALVPGVSRSGSTISAGRVLGLRRTDAARYSFLLSIPAVVLSGLFELRHVGEGLEAVPTLIASVVAFISGYASIAFLIGYLGRHSMTVFTVYRVALGVTILLVLNL